MLGLDFHFGLPQDTDRDWIARIHGFRPWEVMLHLRAMLASFVRAYANPRSLTIRAFGNPRVLCPVETFNRPDVQAAEIPAANGVGQVRSIAKLYGEVATGRAALGLTRHHHNGGVARRCTTSDERFIRRGAACRDPVLSGMRQAVPGVQVRLRVEPCLPDDGPGRVVRLRRPGHRYGLRLRDEPHWIPTLARSSRSGPAASSLRACSRRADSKARPVLWTFWLLMHAVSARILSFPLPMREASLDAGAAKGCFSRPGGRTGLPGQPCCFSMWSRMRWERRPSVLSWFGVRASMKRRRTCSRCWGAASSIAL
ncbi:hypothetical protein RKD38_002135 [Streptomyces ambofaciens]